MALETALKTEAPAAKTEVSTVKTEIPTVKMETPTPPAPARASGAAIAQMLACAALWSIAGIFIKSIPWNPMAIAAGRSLIAAGVAFAYMRWRGMRLSVNRGSALNGAMLSLTFLTFVAANKLTTSANAIALQYSAPIYILAISALVYRQRFRRFDYIAVAVTLAGVALCFADRMDSGGTLGNIIGLASGLFFGAMFMTAGRVGEDSRMTGIVIGHLITAAVGLPFLFLSANAMTGAAIRNIIILGVFQLGVPYVLFGLASGKCPPLAACLLGVVEPILNPLWVFIFDGEAPGPLALAGGVIVIASVTAWTVKGMRKEDKRG
ncbi:MAG: DMT family transporter [Oscillospiraceae bacterium]|jgi:drug/metabolite transporter (DMT)-like permease|nr:DMT family transporter [Oscillospiraceae bacterium]